MEPQQQTNSHPTVPRLGNPKDDKYVVLTRDQWETITLIYPASPLPTPISDAVVIRLQDVFAPSVLWTYANSVLTTIELLEKHLLNQLEPGDYLDLESVHEYFVTMAEAADNVQKKLPTP